MRLRQRRRGRRTWSQRLLITFNLLLAAACVAAAGSFNLARTTAASIPVYNIDSAARTQTGDTTVRNILLVGTDESSGMDPKDPIMKGRKGEHLADTIMILRVDPVAKNASILSIPRDTWVPLAPNWSTSKINGTLSRTDGQAQLIATIRHNFGISIDNYIEVNLSGFLNVFDVLGGITVYNTMSIRDSNTSLHLPQTGCILLEPNQALAYARTRHLQYQDENGKWRNDPSSDYGRIARQQDLLKQAARAAIDKGARNPVTAARLVNSVMGSFATDDTVNADFVLELVSTFREFPIDQLETHRLPTVSVDKSYERVLWDDAAPLLNWFRGLRAPGDVVPSDVIVTLPEADDTSEALSGALDEAGFDSAIVATKGFSGSVTPKTTTIRYGADGVEAAQLLASHLDLDPVREVDFVYVEDLPGRRVELLPASGDISLRSEPIDISMIARGVEFEAPATTTTTAPPTTTTTAQGGDDATEPGDLAQGDDDVTDGDSGDEESPTNSPNATGESASSLSGEPSATTTVGIVPFDAAKAAACPA